MRTASESPERGVVTLFCPRTSHRLAGVRRRSCANAGAWSRRSISSRTRPCATFGAFTKRTGQPTTLELMDTAPMEHVTEIEIDEEHVTITYNEKISHRYNAKEISKKEWSYKYNDDPAFVAAIGAVIELARNHLRDMPDNAACPPGCAECCSGYEPFVSKADVTRIAEHFGIPYAVALDEYVVQRPSADGFSVGYLKKVTGRYREQVRLPQRLRLGTLLLRHLFGTAARLRRVHADRLRRRRLRRCVTTARSFRVSRSSVRSAVPRKKCGGERSAALAASPRVRCDRRRRGP